MALKLVACVLLMEITTFLRETYRNLPRTNKPAGTRFLEPRISQMWGVGRSEARPPITSGGIVPSDHGQSHLAVVGSSTTPVTLSGRRWSNAMIAAQSVANQSVGSVQGNAANTLVASVTTTQQTTTSILAHQQSTIVSPSETSATPPSTVLQVTGTTTTVINTSTTATSGETRRISFVIQDDVESVSTGSQSTLAVQVSLTLLKIA